MSGSSRQRTSAIDEAVEAYEAARGRDGRADLEAFLPSPDHPLYLAVLCELVRVDLEYGYEENRPGRLEDYERRFPELFRDPEGEPARSRSRNSACARRPASRHPLRNIAIATGWIDLDRPATGRGPESTPSTVEQFPAGPEASGRSIRPRDGRPLARSRSPPIADRRSARLAGPSGRGRRHRRLLALAGIVAASLAVIAALAAVMIARQRRIERLEAPESLDRLTVAGRGGGIPAGRAGRRRAGRSTTGSPFADRPSTPSAPGPTRDGWRRPPASRLSRGGSRPAPPRRWASSWACGPARSPGGRRRPRTGARSGSRRRSG